MAWSAGIIVQFPDEATARLAATAIGVEFPDDGSIPSGNDNYAMNAPISAPFTVEPVVVGSGDDQVITPGVRDSGYWALLRLNMEWSGYAETWAAIQATGAVRDVNHVVWA